MLFGRADEELQALEAAGIEYEVVPGITAALAAASAIARPLTKRGVSRSVAFATQAKAADAVDVEADVKADTIVYYMGRDQAANIAAQLIARGKPASTRHGSSRRLPRRASAATSSRCARWRQARRRAGWIRCSPAC
jgi:uroporphyrin-III C-methyltransferase